jgi:hypothetical protein
MAKATEITVDVRVNIPDETICRCLRILEMWMDDNPDKRVVIDTLLGDDGYHHKIRVEPNRVMSKDEMEAAGFET